MLEIRLFATFREGRQKIIMLEPDGFATAGDIVRHLEIDEAEVAICLINGFHSKMHDSVKDGDILAIFPPVGGG